MRRIVRSLRRRFQSLQDELVVHRCRIWLRGLAAPQALRLTRRIFNAIVVSDGQFYFKLGYRRPNTVRLEYEHIEALAAVFPGVAHFLPTVNLIELEAGRVCLRLPMLQVLESKACLDAAIKVLSHFRRYGERRSGCLKDLPQVEQGLVVVERTLPGIAASVSDAASREAAMPMHWGPAHGDFHCGNLLSQDGEPKLIDFDCVRMSAPQEFDGLYFDVEWAAREADMPWLRVVERRLRLPGIGILGGLNHDFYLNRPGLMLLFALDRIGQEAKFGIRQDKRALEDLMMLALSHLQPEPLHD